MDGAQVGIFQPPDKVGFSRLLLSPMVYPWNLMSSFISWQISQTILWKSTLQMRSSVFWYRWIAQRATMPVQYQCGFSSPLWMEHSDIHEKDMAVSVGPYPGIVAIFAWPSSEPASLEPLVTSIQPPWLFPPGWPRCLPVAAHTAYQYSILIHGLPPFIIPFFLFLGSGLLHCIPSFSGGSPLLCWSGWGSSFFGGLWFWLPFLSDAFTQARRQFPCPVLLGLLCLGWEGTWRVFMVEDLLGLPYPLLLFQFLRIFFTVWTSMYSGASWQMGWVKGSGHCAPDSSSQVVWHWLYWAQRACSYCDIIWMSSSQAVSSMDFSFVG